MLTPRTLIPTLTPQESSSSELPPRAGLVWSGLGLLIPLPGLNSQGASGPLPELRHKTKATQPLGQNQRKGTGQQRERAA